MRLVSQQHTRLPAAPIGSASRAVAAALDAETEAAVRHLIARGEDRVALDRAKEIYKSTRTRESEALLVDVYGERIRALMRRGLVVEATALVGLVRDRHRSFRSRLDALIAPAGGRRSLEELVGPLANPALPSDQRVAIERMVRQDVWDLAALAGCEALPAGHDLRTGAAALHRAFVVVTSGPVADDDLELPEISRRSPLASWKLLVRAIASLHRAERDSCERSLQAIDPESVPGRLVPVLRAMLEDDTAAPSARDDARVVGTPRLLPPAVTLRAAMTRKASLVGELEALDRAFVSGSRHGILKSIRSAIKACNRESPAQLDRLKQHISVRSAIADLEVHKVMAAMGGPSLHDATFHRLFARALERTREPERLVLACAMWQEFQQAAAQEGWFADNGPESAAVSLHIAELLEPLPEPVLRGLQQSARRDVKGSGRNVSFLFPDELYQRACVLDPHPEAFSRWMAWAARQPRSRAAGVAKAWHKIRPQDVEPIVFLMEDAEARGALGNAVGYLTKLERIDSLRPDVPHRQFRLLAFTVLDHLRRKKLMPSVDALERLALLPQTPHGEGPTVVAALHAVVGVLRRDAESTSACCAEVERLVGGRAAAALLLSALAAAAKQPSPARLGRVEELSSGERALLPRALARVGLALAELRVALQVPQSWIDDVTRHLSSGRETLRIDELRALAETALQAGHARLAYAATAEGLARGGATAAMFLYLRSRSLTGSLERSVVCARAAAELARDHQDRELVDKALAAAQARFGPELLPLTREQAQEVLRQETAATEPPGRQQREPDYRHLFPQCQCADCRRARGDPVDPFDEVDELDEDDDPDNLDPALDLPPELAAALRGAAAEAARRGESFASFAARVLGGGSAGRRRRPGQRKRRR